ncbi:hypothetical protein BHE74_00027547 [Ensete ventricosum]|nr:hypothetical protein BHE74_00027547 [Ensete ventricosum]
MMCISFLCCQVIVADNFFTGSKDNLRKWIGHPRFELIRHGEFTMMELAEVVKESFQHANLYIINGDILITELYHVLQLIEPSISIKIVENTPDDPRQRKPNITKAKQLLGWEPKITLRQGLPLMEEDFKQRLGVSKKA